MNKSKLLRNFLFCLFASATLASASQAREITVVAAVEKQQAYLGEAIVFQIQVGGSNKAEKPVFELEDFNVNYRGGQANNSDSITIINGRMTRLTKYGYVFSYNLTPRRLGNLIIPALTVKVDGTIYKTKPFSIRIITPEKNSGFILKVKSSKSSCYQGEALELEVTWFFEHNVRNVNLNLPFLANNTLTVFEPSDAPKKGRNFYRIPLNNGEVIAKQGSDFLNGKQFTTLSFKKIIIPHNPGILRLKPGSLSCEALVGYQKNKRRHDPFFDNFFNNRREVYKRFVAISDPLTIRVNPLPQANKPASFSGLVGEFKIEATAKPCKVKVGDPITLTIKLQSPQYLGKTELPPLQQQTELAKNFKIPKEISQGTITGNSKIFTQTIRAKQQDIKEIPALTLSYFNPASGKYEKTYSQAIALEVEATRVVTAANAEGVTAAPLKSEIETLQSGIAQNYEDAGALVNQLSGPELWLRSPLWLCLLLLPESFYLLLLCAVTIIRRRNADPEALKSRKALGLFLHTLKSLQRENCPAAGLLEAWKIYLGSKLRLPHPALTFADIENYLLKKKIGEQEMANLRNIFNACEHSRYAGISLKEQQEDLIADSLPLVKILDKILG